MQENTNKSIAVNSLILYIRLAIISVSGLLYTRFSLQALGISDYGLYSVIACIITSIYAGNRLFPQQRLKNLYGLISENASAEDFPVYELKELLKHREGLLLGSGVESGKIYKMLMNEETTENLNEALSLFDYVEVLPFEKYESANIRIIDICGKSGIPVVAVSRRRWNKG